MPSSRRLIASNTLTSTAASVTFSSIPGTYTDLVVRITARGTGSVTQDTVLTRLNGASSNYSYTALEGNGSSASSYNGSNESYLNSPNSAAGANATSNTFGSLEIYLPSYTVVQNKPLSSFGVAETNATAAKMSPAALLSRNTAAVTSIEFILNSSANFASGSSFFLYGISNT